MKVPNGAQAVVAEAKIVKYLLNEEHLRGGDKAKFFLRFGFTPTDWQIMVKALLQHLAAHDVVSTLTTDEGVHYVVDGVLHTPDGRNLYVRTVWAIDADSLIPRFLTAYPAKKPKEDPHD